MFISENEVYGNMNKIPYYNENYDNQTYIDLHNMHQARPDYGTSNQTFIIDGSGVYITRNEQSYFYGNFELSYNLAYRNGINGVVVHKTDRVNVLSNKIWDNGQVSKLAPELRQSYAGLVLNAAKQISVSNNKIWTTISDDYGSVMVGESSIVSSESSNNFQCGGLVDADLVSKVSYMNPGCEDFSNVWV